MKKKKLKKWIRNKIDKRKKDKITAVQNGNYSTKICQKWPLNSFGEKNVIIQHF